MCCNTKLEMRLRAKHRSCMPQNSQVNRTGEKTKSWRSLGRMLSKSHRRQQWQSLLHNEFFSCCCSCGTLTLTLFFWEEFATTMEGGMAGGWWLFAHFSCPTGMPAQGLDMAISLSMLNCYLTEEWENISYQEGRLLVPGIIFWCFCKDLGFLKLSLCMGREAWHWHLIVSMRSLVLVEASVPSLFLEAQLGTNNDMSSGNF